MSSPTPNNTTSATASGGSHGNSGRQGGNTTGAEQYAQAIHSHSLRGQEKYLRCGPNYEELSKFLNRPPHDSNQTSPHSFVTLRHIKKGHEDTVIDYDSISGTRRFSERPRLEGQAAQILFLRGYPSPEWLSLIGSEYLIDPEFFVRQMNFLQRQNYFDLPALPSATRKIVTLKITTICTRKDPLRENQVRTARKDDLVGLMKHQKNIIKGRVVGDSIVRRFSVHDESTFTLEQNLSLCISTQNGGWAAVAGLDMGRDLGKGPWGEWLAQSSPIPRQNDCLALIQHHSEIALLPEECGPTSESSKCPFPQNTKLLHKVYGSHLNREIVPLDCLYALSEDFALSADSENQFLNFMQTQLNWAMRYSEKEESLSLDTLTYNRGLLDDHGIYLQSIITLLRSHGGPDWPRATLEEHVVVVQKMRETLLGDFEFLFSESQRLSSCYVEGASTIRNRASLRQSRDAYTQGLKVKKLTLAAFIFMSFQFTCAFLSMGLREFGNGNLNMGHFFAVLLPVLAVSAVSMMSSTEWQQLGRYFESHFKELRGRLPGWALRVVPLLKVGWTKLYISFRALLRPTPPV